MTMRVLCLLAAAAAATNLAWGQKGPTVNGEWALPAGSTNTYGGLLLDTPVSGRPFSATAVEHTTHTLEDGTRIDETATTAMYRDAEGRRRTESGGVIQIVDPVARKQLRLNSARKTAALSVPSGFVVSSDQLSKPTPPVATPGSAEKKANSMSASNSTSTKTTENLGTQIVNGVRAYGIRTRLTIPVGEISNDREIVVTEETWTSPDLHVLVKSESYDPRFGRTTYNLTNIVQTPPPAALFELLIPPGYKVQNIYPNLTGH
jgi:hypothetical protein